MARQISKIQADFNLVKTEVETLRSQLAQTYHHYGETMATVAGKELVLAAYQLCTQRYPENFLRLSYGDREKLQGCLRRLGKNHPETFVDLAYTPEEIPQQARQFFAQMLQQIPLKKIAEIEQRLKQREDALETPPPDEVEEAESQAPEEEPEERISVFFNPDELQAVLNNIEDQAMPHPPSDRPEDCEGNHTPQTPEQLWYWHQQLEYRFDEALDTMTRDSNKLLQRSGVLPTKKPGKMREINPEDLGEEDDLERLLAADSGDSEEETPPSRPSRRSPQGITLRRSELEFRNPELGNHKHQLRHCLAQLQKLRNRYRKLEKELAIAEAEAAWRSSWHEG